MAQAEARHHPAPRGQRTARAEATHDALRSQRTSVAGDTEFYSVLRTNSGERGLTGSSRSGRRQERDQRRTVVQTVDSPLVVPSLDVPVPVMVEQLVDVLQFFDALSPVAEQVIDVPKIIIERIPPQTSFRDPLLAEQLVEVPTILYFLKQKVDIPVPGGGGRLASLQGFHPFSSRLLILPASGGLQGFHPGQSLSASSSSPAGVREDTDEPVKGFFELFPVLKKVRRSPGT